jgi:hypothetical protein
VPHPAGAAEQVRVSQPNRSTLHAGSIAALREVTAIDSSHVCAMNRDAGLPTDRLWTQAEAAQYLCVSARYLRDCGCPKVLLPGNGPKGQPLVRYEPADVKAWAEKWNTKRVA